MKQNVAQSIETAATTISYGVSGGTVFLGLNAEEWGIVGVLCGITLGILTFMFNVWWKLRYTERREVTIHPYPNDRRE